MKRDKITAEMIENRIKHQMPESEKIGLSDYMIINDHRSSLIKQVEKLLDEVGNCAKSTQ